MSKNLRQMRGFSLIEMMVVISIIAILMVGALGSLQSLMKNTAETRMTSLQKLIDYSVVMARSERRNVIVCAITPDSLEIVNETTNEVTTPQCMNNTNWGDNGIVAFFYEEPVGYVPGDPIEAAVGDDVISSLRGGDGGVIDLSLFGNSSRLSIRPDGFFATGQGNIVYCRDNEFQAALIINIVGRVRYSSEKGIYSC